MPHKGRKPGSPNKLTKNMREIIMVAFTKAGGCDYLVRQSKEEPKAFMALLGRVVPQEIAVSIHNVDLGAEMRLAAERLDRLNAPKDVTPEPVTLEHEPTPPVKVAHVKVARDTSTPVTLEGDNMESDGEMVKRVSRKKRQVERVKKK